MKTFDTDQSNLVGNLPRVTNKFTGNLVKVDRKPSQGNTVKTQKPCEGDSRTLTRFSVKFFLFLFFIPAVLLCQVQKSEKYELRKEQVYSTPQLAGSNATTKPYFQPMTKSAAFNSNVRPMDIKSESVSNEAPISNAVLSAKISKSMSMTPQGIVYNGIDNQFSPQIAVDGNEMFTAFVNNDTTGGYPYGKVSIYKSTDGGTSWTKWTSIFSSAASLENPKICLAGNQVIISFIYVQYLGTYRFDRTTKDGLFTYVSSPTITATDYVVGQQLCTDAVQYPTTPYIYLTYLFRQSDGSTAVLFSRSIDTARTWEDYQSLGYTTPALSTPTVGMDFGSSGLFVSYLGSGTNTGTIMIRKSTIYGSGSSWSSEVSIPLNVNGGPNAKIGPLVSTVGLRVAIVYQYDYSNNAVDYKTATDFDINGLLSSDGGVTWREVLVAGSSSNEILPTITHDVDFSFYVGFMRNNRMCVAMAGNELAFSTPDSSSSTNASMNYFPGIAGSSISGTRQAYAVWTGINTDADIYNSVVSLKIPPLSPTNLITTAASASQVNLIWTDNSSDETGFRIKWSTSASSVYTNSATVGANISSYQVTGLNPSTQYDFFVQAYNANGNSPGAVGSATTSSSGNPPTITSFSPTSGPIGTTVTITGTNFSATASNNIVFFGGIKASVTNATATSLAVTVPSGAVYAPITVTTNNLSASSRLFYTPTFSGNWSLTSTSFAAKTDVNTTGQSFSVAEGDLDGDGKLDLVASNYSGGSVSVFLNTSSSGSITYATKVDFNTGNAPYTVALGDIDGDGKLDIVTTNNSSNTISVLRNTSTPGNLSFASNVDFAMGSNPWGVALADLDGDGKLDVIASGNGSNISVLRNTSSVGTISFAAFQSFGTNVYAWTLAVGDFDGDGKIDVAAASCVNSIVSVFRNTSAVGSISLATNSDYSINSTGSAVAIGDLDGDGKLDIVAGTSSSNTQLSVLLNTSSSGAISFASKVGFTGTQPFGVALGDLDGNGKIDIAATNYNGSTGNTISVFRSNSTSGNAGFEAALNFTSGTGPRAILIGDLDGDGKPDLITANSSSTLSIFRNTVSSNTTPAAPQNLTATAGNGQVTLKWNKNTEADFLKYRIYMGTDSTSVNLKDSSSASISDTSKTIIGLTNGTKYYFRVSALNSARLESGKSVAASSIPNVITLCVSTAGSDANSGTATAPLRNIQTALTRAAIGDTIKVTRGSYSEVMTTQKQVVVRGGYQELFSETNRDIFLNKTYVRSTAGVLLTDTYGSTIDGFLLYDSSSSGFSYTVKLNNGSVLRHNVIRKVGSATATGITTNGGAIVQNNIVYGYTFGIDINSGTGTPIIKNNILANCSWGMTTDGYSEAVRTYNDIYGSSFIYDGSYTTPGIGDIQLNPNFKDAGNNDFRILESSPCVDAGDPSDSPGEEPAPYNSRIDMGAYGGMKYSPYLPLVPITPVPAVPANGATHQSLTLTLKWNSSSGTSNYRVQIGIDSTFAGGIIIDDATLIDTIKAVSGLIGNTKYYWRVNARNTSGTSLYSMVFSFTTTNGLFCVSTTGSDANAGTATAPLRNIQTALNKAVIGDTIKVTRGSYSEVMTTQKQVVVRGGYQELFSETNRDIFLNKTYVRSTAGVLLTDTYGSTIDGFLLYDSSSSGFSYTVKLNNGSVLRHNVIRKVGSATATGITTNGGAIVQNNIVYGYTFGIDINSGTGTPTIKNNILANCSWGMTTDGYSEAVRTYNDIYGSSFIYDGSYTTPGIGDIQLNPNFKDAGNNDFRILESSPCVDAGDPSDSPGEEPAPYNSRIDMGAYGGTKYSPYLPTNLAPSTPKNLIAIAGNGMVTLKWNKNTENDVLRYRIYIGTDSNSVSLKDSSASILDTVKIVTGLPNGAIYYFRVSAMNNLRLESGKSYAVSVTIPNVQSPTITLTSPIGGELWNEDHTHPIQYQASDQVGVTRIKILYSTNGGQTYTTIVDSTRNSGFCNWTVPRIPSTLAKVKVIAYNAQGFSASDSSHANFIICDVSSYVHATGALSLTVRNDGTIGTTDSLRRFTEPSMEYPPGSNKHHLYLGELVIATIRGTDTITTSLYGDYFTPVGLVTAINHGSYIETQSHFIDKMYLGLDLTQRTFGIAGQASVIVSYSIKNTGTTSFPAFYVGFHTDFDLNNPALNLPGFDVVNKLGYMYDAQGGWTSYAGIRLLDRSIGGFKRILGTEGFPTPGDFYRRMTAAGNDNTSSDVQADHRIIEMLPAVNLPIGESTTVTFALAAGAGLTGLQTASQQAQTQWTQINVAAPTPPRNLTAIAGNGQVTLRWNKNTEADFLKYFVYMGSDSITMSLKDSTSGGINDTVHSITQLLNGTKYYFRVTALNSARSESAQSYAVSATPKVPTVIVPIGTGTITDRHIPVEPYYGYSYSQVIYLASEINNFGNIVTLQWYFSGSSLSSSNNWTIYLGHTTKTAFNSSTDWIPLSSLTQVYSGSFSSPSESGWITFDITDFAYNGLDNLVVAVDENASDFNSSSDDFYCTSVSNTRSIYYYNDSDNIDPSSPPAGTTQSYIANIQVGIFQPLIMPPQNLTAAAGDGQVTLKWNKNKEADLLRYRIYCGTSPHPTTKVDSSTASNLDTTKIIIGLTNGTTYYFRVTAINNTGLESGYSNEVSATPKPEENILRLSPFAVSSLYLNEQIAADTLRNGKLSNRVYILQRGGVYRVNTSIMNYNWTLRIRANDSTTTQKPIIFLYPSPTTGVLPAQFINVSGDVELKNLIVSGYYELADTNLRSLQGTLLRVTTTSGWKIVIDSCILSNAMNHIRTEVAASVIKVTNTVFANMGYLGKSNVGAGRVFDFREVSIDSLIIQNCTFVNSLDRIIRHVGITSPYTTSPIKYILFDHNTLVNGTGYHGILAFGNVSDRSIITNNLLFDAFALGNDTDYTRQLSPEFASSGEKDRYDRNRITWIYSEPNQTAQWTISNNYYGISDSGRAFYNQYASAGVTGEGSPLTWHINSRLGADSIGAFKKIWIVPSKVPALMTELMRWYRSPSGGNKTKNTPAAWIYGDVNTHPYADPFDYDRKGYSWLQDSLNCSYYSSVKPSSTDGKVVGDSRWNFKGIVSDPYALPAAPQNLTAIAGNGQVTLRWSKNIEADFLKYRIYRGTTSGGETLVDSSSASITDTIKTISGLTNEQIYYFHITAMNTARLESGYSNEVSATPTNNPVLSVNPATLSFSSLIVSTTSPEKTYSLSGANLSPATGNITVTAPTAFEVSLTSGSGFTSSINASYTNGTLSTTVYVHFKPISLIAYSGNISNSGGGATAQSVSVSGTGIQQITIPAAPTNLSASVISGSQINLSWTDVSNNEDGFKIERKIGTSGIYSLRVTLGENVQSYSDTGLAELTTYYYRIYAYNTGGSSEYANEAYAITKDTTAPSAPTAVQISPSIWTNQNKFDIAWTNPSDPSGIAKVWYTIDVVPTVAQPGTGVGITQAQLQVTLAAGTNSGKHTIYMYLEDGANNKDPNKIANVIVRYDNNKPAITDNSTLPTVTVENGNASPQVIITCSATDGAGESGVQSFVLQYIRVGDTQIDSNSINAPFDVTTNKQIPTSVFVSSDGKAKGVSYRLKAVDTAGNATSTLWKSIVVQNASTVTINTPTTFPAASNYASTEIVKAYRIFSIPYDLNDKRPVDFIPQSLGDHASNGINYYNWRLQRYVNGVKQDYEDFKNDLTAAAPGNGFFLIVRDPQKKISIGPNKEVPADLMNNTGISLANGWNLVGTPLNMDIKFDSLVFSGGTYADRAYYDGAGSVSGWHKSGANIDVMKAWEGLAIKMNGAGTMRFRTLGPQLRVGEKDGIYGKTITAGAQVLSKTAMNWIVSVDAYRSDIGMRCEGNSIGMAQDARDGQDAYDSFMPPFVGDRNVAVYFQNPDGAMMRDIRPLNDDGGVWDMRVITGDAAAKVKLQFGDVMNLPNPQFEAFVIDIDQRMAYNLKDVSKIEINSGNGARNLRVVVGKKLYIEQNNAGVELYPTTMKLFANYPNPFNPETIIRYTVPNASPSYTVILKIFNVLGQEITTLINAQQKSGYYEVKYAAQNQSSGVYFYQINVSDGMQVFKDVKKMVLMK